MLGNLFNSFHSKKENNETKIKHNFLKKDNKKDKNKKVSIFHLWIYNEPFRIIFVVFLITF